MNGQRDQVKEAVEKAQEAGATEERDRAEMDAVALMRKYIAPQFDGDDVFEVAVIVPKEFNKEAGFDDEDYATIHRVIAPEGAVERAVEVVDAFAERLNRGSEQPVLAELGVTTERPVLAEVRLDARYDSELADYRRMQGASVQDVFSVAIGLPTPRNQGAFSIHDAEAYQPFLETRVCGPRGSLEDFLARLKALIQSYPVEASELDFSTELADDDPADDDPEDDDPVGDGTVGDEPANPVEPPVASKPLSQPASAEPAAVRRLMEPGLKDHLTPNAEKYVAEVRECNSPFPGRDPVIVSVSLPNVGDRGWSMDGFDVVYERELLGPRGFIERCLAKIHRVLNQLDGTTHADEE